MIKAFLAVVLFSAVAAAQTSCPLTPLRKVSATQPGTCIRTLGVVTYIARSDAGFLVTIADKKGNSLEILSRDEPYTNELLEVWGVVKNAAVTGRNIPWPVKWLRVTSSRIVVIKSQARKECNPCEKR